MNIFKQNKEIENQELISTLQEQNNLLKQELDDNRSTISNFATLKANWDDEKTKLMTAHKKELENYKLLLDRETKSVNRKVNKVLESIGVTKFAVEEISPESTLQSDTDVYKKFCSMPQGEDKQQFFKAHEREISRAIGL